MIIGQIKNGIVLDHITAGRGMDIYNILHLGELDCTVAMIKNAESQKMGQKDIIKIGQAMDLNLDILGYIDPGITVDIIRDGKRVEKKQLTLPETITDVIRCKNPRCITSVEQGLTHIFRLADPKNKVYRCIYCDSAARR
ncbi:MAG: aspartate carbamoyltransferase regulatory subunit [Oscillospiraceae bacterium]|nr:aspartate carbamoyltransferase regulatory subunit [Oscillospiraceae bacterium]MCD7712504.1 aspartate carbamoyltransferase regulatory subunit [Bacillota bacterium]MCC8156255.1 aspartate carbamoyltransferase regulatory subunit [Oscillospiraceae bacterium]MCD7787146.1 aspartate carbamoyltransferase regulatory subunit [Oscillospiraceae bacterium]MCD7852709.1 aspartate carbamoyltransferase regulatory subunit [Oscillospiraceae bacterium]